MNEHAHEPLAANQPPPPGSGFWRTGTGMALIVFLVIGALLLGYEHRLHIFGSSSGSALFLIVWIGMHFLMHRGHGGHGRHGGHGSAPTPQEPKKDGEPS